MASGTINNKVSKSGDTMSGNLEIQSGNTLIVDYDDIDSSVIPSKNVVRDAISLQGINNIKSYIRLLNMTDGTQGIQLGTDRNDNISNAIRLVIDNNGNRKVTVSNAAVWRTALGLSLTREYVSPSDVSIPNNTNTTVWEYEFSSGLYLIFCTAIFASNSTGNRYLYLANANGSTMGGTYQVRVRAADDASTIIGFSGVLNLTANTTFLLRASQTSGGALTVTPRIGWLKIL